MFILLSQNVLQIMVPERVLDRSFHQSSVCFWYSTTALMMVDRLHSQRMNFHAEDGYNIMTINSSSLSVRSQIKSYSYIRDLPLSTFSHHDTDETDTLLEAVAFTLHAPFRFSRSDPDTDTSPMQEFLYTTVSPLQNTLSCYVQRSLLRIRIWQNWAYVVMSRGKCISNILFIW